MPLTKRNLLLGLKAKLVERLAEKQGLKLEDVYTHWLGPFYNGKENPNYLRFLSIKNEWGFHR